MLFQKEGKLKNTYLLFFPLALFGLLISAYLCYVASCYEEIRIQVELDKSSQILASALHRELAVNFQTVEALRSLYESSPEVSREDFARYALPYTQHDSLQALEWIPLVKWKTDRSIIRVHIRHQKH